MIESPVLQEFLREHVAESQRKSIMLVLVGRFGPGAHLLAPALESIKDHEKLDELTKFAATCPDLDAFEQEISSRG